MTVALPIRNEAEFIEKCLRSVTENDYPADWIEMLVVGASEGTLCSLGSRIQVAPLTPEGWPGATCRVGQARGRGASLRGGRHASLKGQRTVYGAWLPHVGLAAHHG